ncbi:MAG: hypothetical protein WC346_03170 [Methanogenium sp.]|jgi:hypothetical protein
MNEKWSCHICGKMRDDEDIEVLTYLLKDLPGAERNIRYCRDNEECKKKAEEKAISQEV